MSLDNNNKRLPIWRVFLNTLYGLFIDLLIIFIMLVVFGAIVYSIFSMGSNHG